MNAGATVSFIGFNDPSWPASNALQNIVLLLVSDDARPKCVYIGEPAVGLATFSIKFKAQVFINGVTLLPPYNPYEADGTILEITTNVAIYGLTTGGTQQLCGILADFYSQYSEVTCKI
jgi:hypothetical protein